MNAGPSDHVWSFEEPVSWTPELEVQKRGPHKKRIRHSWCENRRRRRRFCRVYILLL